MDAQTDARRRGAETKRRRTVESLRSAALTLVNRDGPDLKVSEVASLAGVSEATFYNVWTSRDEMFGSLFDLLMDHTMALSRLDKPELDGLGVFTVMFQRSPNIVRCALTAYLKEPANLDAGMITASFILAPRLGVAVSEPVISSYARSMLISLMILSVQGDRPNETQQFAQYAWSYLLSVAWPSEEHVGAGPAS